MGVIHLRVASPPERTEQVLALLARDACVVYIVVHRGVLHPAGDVIECDVLAGAANDVLARLRELQVHRHGSLMVDPVDLVMSDRADAAAAALRGPLARAPVWAEVEARIDADATYTPSFYLYLVIAGVIGAIGLLTNSQILIVAAMILCPDYGAIIGVALGVDRRDGRPVRRGLAALTVGFGLAVVAAYAFTMLVRALGLVPTAFTLGLRPVTHLIDTPNFYSVVVAVLAGIAGVVALTHTRTSTLLGVFVSVTTIPAAADIGVALAAGSAAEARGSLLQLLLNIALLIVVGFVTLRAQRALWGRISRRALAHQRRHA
ncbi:membrane protein [Catellatospora citrea]|uniref:Membrane protein n=1 Tax=Catellatospora citrea TaxID=53366 RepID=A0A8J3KJ69_9ACTN|nr:putative hydrophobic protein (TIGR00271 family) [Catellatospora citrea]GIF98148.1 membrane protein [Catellatospora citrea]